MENFSKILAYEWRTGIRWLRETPIDGKTSDTTAYLFDYLHSMTDKQGRCWPANDQIEQELGLTRPTIVHARKILQALSILYNVPFNERTPIQKQIHRARWVYQFTGIALHPETQELKIYSLMEPEAIAHTLNNLYARGIVKSFNPETVKSFNTKNFLPKEVSLDDFKEVSTQEDFEIIELDEVEQIERTHPNWAWVSVEPRIDYGEPYREIDTLFTRLVSGQVMTATRYNDKWVFMDPLTLLVHITTRKGEDTLPENIVSADYARIRNMWARVGLAKLDALHTESILRAWIKKTRNGDASQVKFWPASAEKVLAILGGAK